MTPSSIQPRPHQVEALAALQVAFSVHDRTQLIMACGTGKTFVGRWHAEASDARTVVVLVPSLSLLAQTLIEWRRVHGWPFDALVVCSDPTTSAGAAERVDEDGDAVPLPDWSTARANVTTDPQVAASFLTRSPTRAKVVFSTYHSAPVVADAQARTQVVFDLAICDEAHRLAGSPRDEFRVVLNPRALVARRRLFMTATPKVSTATGVYSMDDPTIFGPVAHAVSFGDAIKAGLLCDYRVVVVGVEGTKLVDDDVAATPAALLAAIDAHQLRRILTFHSRVAKAESFARALEGTATRSGTRIHARHLSGTMPAQTRRQHLDWLAAPTVGDVTRVISNARVLTEGIDVPGIDGICFADRRSSVVDIIQAVGRVLRPHPGKSIGTIIIPIGLPNAGDDDTELLVSRFGLLWSVLRALRSHDERLALDIDRAIRNTMLGTGHYRPVRVSYQLPDWLPEDVLHTRLVQDVGDAWEKHHASCLDWALLNPGRRLPRNTVHLGFGIGEWAMKQRTAHSQGLLPTDRGSRLEQIPGWYWNRGDAAWDDTLQILRDFALSHGDLVENPTGPSIFAGMRAAKPTRDDLAIWLATQRQAYRAGTLNPRRATELEQLPGWTWSPIPVGDLAMVDALGQFVEFEKHAQVPDGHLEGGLELGRWVWDVRRRKLTGTLSPALEAEIWAATPSRWRTGARIRWQWETAETQWRLAYTALRVFTNREGHACPTTTHTEQLHDTTIRVGQWVALQRHQHRHGELDPRRVAALDRLPGWQWEGDVGGSRPPEPPIELPAHLKHGSAGAVSNGCGCSDCLEYTRAASRRSKARQREQLARRGVDARPTRAVLIPIAGALEDKLSSDRRAARRGGLGRPLIATTADVPLTVVRGVLEGTLDRIQPEHARRLGALTIELCLANVSHTGSRGRPIQSGTERIDAGPTLQLIADLERRGFNRGWMARELGLLRTLQTRGPQVTASTAAKIRDLHKAVGDMVAPRVPPTQRLPSLKELTTPAA